MEATGIRGRGHPKGKAWGPKQGKSQELGEREGKCRNSFFFFFPGAGARRLSLASNLEASPGQIGFWTLHHEHVFPKVPLVPSYEDTGPTQALASP